MARGALRSRVGALSVSQPHPGPRSAAGVDAFFVTPLSGSLFQWWYQHHTMSPAAFGSFKLAYTDTPADQLRFADFDGDHITDVFKLERTCPEPDAALDSVSAVGTVVGWAFLGSRRLRARRLRYRSIDAIIAAG